MYFELIVFLYYILTSVWFSLSARWQMLVLWRPACRSTASLWVSVFTGCRQKCNTINFTDETWRNLCFWKKCWKIIWIKNKVIYGRILYWQIKFIHFCNQWNLYTIYIEHYTCKQSRFIPSVPTHAGYSCDCGSNIYCQFSENWCRVCMAGWMDRWMLFESHS